MHRLTVMLTAKDPPYEALVVANARAAATKVEQMLFEKSPDEDAYKRKIAAKLESMAAHIVKQRAKRAMEEQGLKMAEAPAAKTPQVAKVEQSSSVPRAEADAEYAAGKLWFEAQEKTVQSAMRKSLLMKWVNDNKQTSQIAHDLMNAPSQEVKRQLYYEKLKEHLDVHMFKQLQQKMQDGEIDGSAFGVKRARDPYGSSPSLNAELQGFVSTLMKNEDEADAQARKRHVTDAARASAAADAGPTPQYWLKVADMNEKYHAQLSKALKWVREYEATGARLGQTKQKFVDLLTKILLPTITQTPHIRDPSIPNDIEYLEKVDSAIKKALSRYEATEKSKQEQQRLKLLTPAQRALVGLTDTRGETKAEALKAISETCGNIANAYGVMADFSHALYDSDEDEDEDDGNFPTNLLKDWLGKAEPIPAGAPNTWTIESDKDVLGVAFLGDDSFFAADAEPQRVATLADY
jgi:hypothetical protein